MSQHHERIVQDVQLQWTREKRGRLFKNPNGKAWRGRCTDERLVGGRRTIELFDAVMIKYGLENGSSDLMGWEDAEYIDTEFNPVTLPIICAVEVKTLHDRLKPEQINWLNTISRIGGRAYVARENEDGGYDLQIWEVQT